MIWRSIWRGRAIGLTAWGISALRAKRRAWLGRRSRFPTGNRPPGARKPGRQHKVRLNCPTLCYRYTARVIRGVKVKPSPRWLIDRLATIGVGAINNVADITNYVLMECGQPLHAFDFQKLNGREIIVREARKGERF